MIKIITINIHPFSRLAFLIGAIICVLFLDEIFILLPFYLCYILPVILLIGNFKMHFRLLVFGIVPIFLTFVLLYIVIMNGSNGAWDFIILKCLKILGFTSIFQITLSIPPEQLIVTFKKWGFKGDGLLTMIGAFTVWAEVRTKSYQIITARFARGFIGKRNLLNTARQLPFVLIPLIIGIVRTATERVDVWEQREIPKLIKHVQPDKIKYSAWFNIIVVVIPWSLTITLTYLHFV